MKKLLLLLSIIPVFMVSSCTATKEAGYAGSDLKKEKAAAEEAIVRNAIESRRFIIKLDRLYLFYGMVDLVPRLNYIIVDGNKAVINTAYLGRQWDIRPIAGINVRGNTEKYEVTNKYSRGLYEISMKISNQSALFNVNLTVGKNGTVNASVNGMRIETARYRGYVVPIRNQENNSEQQDSEAGNVI